jgi:hypothetical protein
LNTADLPAGESAKDGEEEDVPLPIMEDARWSMLELKK